MVDFKAMRERKQQEREMNKPNFSSILDRPATEIEKPKPFPVGTYLTVIQGLPRYDKSAKKQTPFVEFTHKFVSALDDVDTDELQAMGGIENKTIKNTYYETEDAAWRIKKFLEDCGFDDELEGGRTMRECIEATPNVEVYITIRHEASQDGRSVFARINDTAKVD